MAMQASGPHRRGSLDDLIAHKGMATDCMCCSLETKFMLRKQVPITLYEILHSEGLSTDCMMATST